MSLKDFIRDTVNLGKDDIFKVDVKDSFSFFNTDAAATEAILKTFTEFKVDGRFVNVEVSKNPGGGGGGSGSRGRRDRSRSGGGRDSRDSDRNKGRRRERSTTKGSSPSSSGKRRTKRKSDFF
jgi:ATP-dependent RNA helicase DeaD